MAHTYEITWHGEDANTMRARVNSQEALVTLRQLISSDPNLIISSVTEFDQYGVPITKAHASRSASRPPVIDIPALVREVTAVRKARPCISGVGPSLCSRFPQCGHSSLLGTADELPGGPRVIPATTEMAAA